MCRTSYSELRGVSLVEILRCNQLIDKLAWKATLTSVLLLDFASILAQQGHESCGSDQVALVGWAVTGVSTLSHLQRGLCERQRGAPGNDPADLVRTFVAE